MERAEPGAQVAGTKSADQPELRRESPLCLDPPRADPTVRARLRLDGVALRLGIEQRHTGDERVSRVRHRGQRLVLAGEAQLPGRGRARLEAELVALARLVELPQPLGG